MSDDTTCTVCAAHPASICGVCYEHTKPRVEELKEEVNANAIVDAAMHERIGDMEPRKMSLPPEGYVAVMLPREDVELYASDDSEYGDGPPGVGRFTTVGRVRLNKACLKALEAEDA